MKNINLYILLALVALMAFSCNDDLSKYAEIRRPDLHIVEEPPESGVYLKDFVYEPEFMTIEGEDTTLFNEFDY